MNILESIMAERRAAVSAASQHVSMAELQSAARGRRHHGIRDSLARNPPGIIAEMKKASPSAGLLRPDYRPADIGALYAQHGAAGISILTEPRHFLGDGDHLRAVRASVDLPVLRKDFMCAPYQVWEAAAWGADIVLLIVAALDPVELRELHAVAGECGVDVLAESHTAAEIERALDLDEAVIGVNSRNLKTLKTDLRVAIDLAPCIPADRLCIAESGIKTRADILRLDDAGYNGFLIGEALMADGDPAGKLDTLRGVAETDEDGRR